MPSEPNTTYTVELFESPFCDPSGFGEAWSYLGSVEATSDPAGDAAFEVVLPDCQLGYFITATATDERGNTSELSECREVLDDPPDPPDPPIPPDTDDESGSGGEAETDTDTDGSDLDGTKGANGCACAMGHTRPCNCDPLGDEGARQARWCFCAHSAILFVVGAGNASVGSDDLQSVQPFWKTDQSGITAAEHSALQRGQMPPALAEWMRSSARRWNRVGIGVALLGVFLLIGAAAAGLYAFTTGDPERYGVALMLGVFGLPACIIGGSFARVRGSTDAELAQIQIFNRVGVLRSKRAVGPRGAHERIGAEFRLDIDGVELRLIADARPVYERLRQGARYRLFHVAPPSSHVVWIEPG